ncbi:MAG: TolC family protein [Chitinophagaceae bacterium]|nr:TolC family protein [Chitinophagaceae bacterium]
MRKIIFTVLLAFLIIFANAQDSTKVLSLKTFLQIVKQYHPVAKQASIIIQKADANVLLAKAGFDPIAEIDGSNKTFDGVNYYQGNQAQLKIPTWYGIELSTGIEYLAGNRLDNQQSGGKTSFAGITLPLAKNLVIDKRRAALQQAKIMQGSSVQEQRVMINNLLLEATEYYWKWVEAYYIYKTYNNVIAVNQKRTDLVKLSVKIGERPAIDTTEAIAQLQNFEYLQNEALLAWQNSSIMLNTFLWKENAVAYELPTNVLPHKKVEELYDAIIFPELAALLDNTKKNHPELQLYNFKLSSLAVDKKLKFQELLPKLDLKYNQLGKGYNIASTATKTLFDNNYRFGLGFSMPLRLSQGRGEYKLAKLKMNETQLKQSQKEIEIINKVKNYYNQLVNYKAQVNLLLRNYENYFRLQKGEELRFFNGESSLFLINSRETKALETLIKLTETTVKYNKTEQGLLWSTGQLWQY